MKLITAKESKKISTDSLDQESFDLYIKRANKLIHRESSLGSRSCFIGFNRVIDSIGTISPKNLKKIKKELRKSGYRISWISLPDAFEIWW